MIQLRDLRGRVIATAMVAAAICAAPAAAGRFDELYRATAVVTGTGEANRASGLAQSIEDVVVKVSGDPRLIGDPRVAAMGRDAEVFVKKFTYRDRLEGLPINDEQGAYDRPHDLIVDFNRLRINTALKSLGRKPWTAPRPRLAVFLSVERGDQAFVATSEGVRDEDMRQALSAASARAGLEIALPRAATLTAAGLNARTVPEALFSTLETVATSPDADLPLVGALTWSDAANGCIADWRMRSGGDRYAWRIEGVSYDDAFRNGLHGALQILSGNGQPEPDPAS